MPPKIAFQSYGKSQVRVSHIRRDGDFHEFIELSCSIELQGDFDAAYTAADNSLVVPTDTIKNTVYALAGRHGIASSEGFARRLARHFVESYPQVDEVSIRVEELPWQRMLVDGELQSHSFVGATNERYVCEVQLRHGELNQMGSLSGLKVLKTTGSAFTGFHTDDLTTLQPTSDRIFATTIDAGWRCLDPEADWELIRLQVKAKLLTVFSQNHSESVQHTLYEMAEAVLDACPELDAFFLKMPNQHHLLANLGPFKIENNNSVFIPTDEPFGNISAMVKRGDEEAQG